LRRFRCCGNWSPRVGPFAAGDTQAQHPPPQHPPEDCGAAGEADARLATATVERRRTVS
jgi:hypothetical protein